ncbi:regulatory protein GemA [Vibrio europaeus]|uniref:gp16 family protein n=1 Tax=Vibrio europaeus TaxID=300876 RepID=UPI00233EBEE5|nr:regulatory protein GemA [Vibrio europaeus]MDC5753837.1 regulatory protein GemA [Vibrio europaeus]MDC5776749.1 regulatory protein GemA [Vibrio europaeus]MDC5796765.1 regulatory protein GemA [Vibrio europaeus]MDC5801762.1 regulatory protein GemA [Vibrio europaeus]MDC5815735.1 regulatory protein GemA [Vibrio europaeus]
MNQRNRLIQIIHVAKRELALEDDVYRMLLESTTGKTSCSKMNIKELEQVLDALESKGFKRQGNTSKKPFKKRLSPKSGKSKNAIIDKCRAVWIQMAVHGFVRDRSENALDSYAQRILKKDPNKVDCIAWCDENQAATVLEALKCWHHRVMIDEMKEKGWTVPVNERTGKPMGYDAIAQHYNWMLSLRKEAE